MKTIIVVAAALAFGGVSLVHAQSAVEKVEKAGAANAEAVAKKKAKDKAEAEARDKANKEARDKSQGEVKAKMKATGDGMDKKRAETANDPKPKR